MKPIPARETPYCTACATRLRSWDFFASRAIFAGNLPYCTPCAPARDLPQGLPFRGGARRLPTNWNLL